jgi:hypothetical protein
MTPDPAAVARKLRLGAAARPVVLGAPDRMQAWLEEGAGGPLPAAIDGTHDWILLFSPDRAALEAGLPAAAAALETPGTLWLAYPKGTSKAQGDLTRDRGWESVRDTDLMWLGLVAIDATWSAFSLRHHRAEDPPRRIR